MFVYNLSKSVNTNIRNGGIKMKETGVLRRIDELGRIVIPKELRKKLKIREGDFLDIFVEDNNIVLQKYSALKDIEAVLNSLVVSLGKSYNLKMTIVDSTNVIASNFNKLKADMPISNDLLMYINKCDTTLLNKNVNLNVSEGINAEANILIKPITVYGDLYGAVLIFFEYELPKDKMEAINLACSFIVDYIEA